MAKDRLIVAVWVTLEVFGSLLPNHQDDAVSPHQRRMLPRVWSQFPSNAVRDGIIQGSWYIDFSSVEPKHDGRTGTLTSYICCCDGVCRDLLKSLKVSTYKADEFPARFTAEPGWNPVWVISVFALAVQNAFHFQGFSFMILNKEWLDV